MILDVVSRREDGFHDLAMVNLPIELYDVLSISVAEEDSFLCNVHYLSPVENNTIMLAINKLRQIYGFKECFKVELIKYIPAQAGLGGGSSDAAMAIQLLNDLLGLKMDIKTKAKVAVQVGKDVPFCLSVKPALAKGTGEKLSFFPNNCDLSMLLVKPKTGIATKAAYEKLDENPIKHFPTTAMIEALKDNDYPQVMANLGNSFEDCAMEMVPEIATIKKELSYLGFDASLLCGSGSCVMGFSQDEELLEKGLRYFRQKYPFVWKTKAKRSLNG